MFSLPDKPSCWHHLLNQGKSYLSKSRSNISRSSEFIYTISNLCITIFTFGHWLCSILMIPSKYKHLFVFVQNMYPVYMFRNMAATTKAAVTYVHLYWSYNSVENAWFSYVYFKGNDLLVILLEASSHTLCRKFTVLN